MIKFTYEANFLDQRPVLDILMEEQYKSLNKILDGIVEHQPPVVDIMENLRKKLKEEK